MPNNNVLLNDHELTMIKAMRDFVKVTDEAIAEYGSLPFDQIPDEVNDRVNNAHDEFVRLLGFNPDDPKSDIQVLIETMNLFHRAIPSEVVEEFWGSLLGPTVLILAATGSLSPIVMTETMQKLILQLKIDQDGWVEGFKESI